MIMREAEKGLGFTPEQTDELDLHLPGWRDMEVIDFAERVRWVAAGMAADLAEMRQVVDDLRDESGGRS